MRETLGAHRPVIICELHDTHVEFAELMRDVGYRLVNLEGTTRCAAAPAPTPWRFRGWTRVTDWRGAAGTGIAGTGDPGGRGRRGSRRLQAGLREQLAASIILVLILRALSDSSRWASSTVHT